MFSRCNTLLYNKCMAFNHEVQILTVTQNMLLICTVYLIWYKGVSFFQGFKQSPLIHRVDMFVIDIALCQFFRLFQVVEAERLILANSLQEKQTHWSLLTSQLIQGYCLYHSGWHLLSYFSSPQVLEGYSLGNAWFGLEGANDDVASTLGYDSRICLWQVKTLASFEIATGARASSYPGLSKKESCKDPTVVHDLLAAKRNRDGKA